uniref:Uncharacterized protein n=1 Tax=Moniliophthora roreri TaxID=221103 RepID=A0A0W0G6P6_MONRR
MSRSLSLNSGVKSDSELSEKSLIQTISPGGPTPKYASWPAAHSASEKMKLEA